MEQPCTLDCGLVFIGCASDAASWLCSHLPVCPHRPATCPICSLQLQAHRLPAHVKHCRTELSECPHCGKGFPEKELRRHIRGCASHISTYHIDTSYKHCRLPPSSNDTLPSMCEGGEPSDPYICIYIYRCAKAAAIPAQPSVRQALKGFSLHCDFSLMCLLSALQYPSLQLISPPLNISQNSLHQHHKNSSNATPILILRWPLPASELTCCNAGHQNCRLPCRHPLRLRQSR